MNPDFPSVRWVNYPSRPASQQNAVRKAESYLDIAAFSRQGLIDQLEYDDFSTEDATFAVDSITVDWNEQAARAAKQYLDTSASPVADSSTSSCMTGSPLRRRHMEYPPPVSSPTVGTPFNRAHGGTDYLHTAGVLEQELATIGDITTRPDLI